MVGWALERFLIRRMYGRELPEQLLLTFALILIIGDLIKLIWGVQNRRIVLPIDAMPVFDSFINPYLFVIIAMGALVGLFLWWFLARTRIGKIVRAAVYSRDMVSALGIPIPADLLPGIRARRRHRRLQRRQSSFPSSRSASAWTWTSSSNASPSWSSAASAASPGRCAPRCWSAILYSFSVLIWPNGALAVVFVILVAVLIWRPWGLFGTEMRS